MPVEVLLADKREVLPRRHAEARAERPAELTRAAEAAAPGDVRQRLLVLVVCEHEPQSLVEPRFNNTARIPPSAAGSR